MARKPSAKKQLEALASEAGIQLAIVQKRGESFLYAAAKLGFILIKAQQIHLCATSARRCDTSGLLLGSDGFQTWFAEVFQPELGFSLRSAYNYINVAHNVLHLTRPEVDLTDHHTLDIAAVEEAEKTRLLKGWKRTDAYKSLPGPELPMDFVAHICALYDASRAKDKAKAVWGKLTRSLEAWEANPSDPDLAIPGYGDEPPPREDETGLPALWVREDFAALEPAEADDDRTAAKTRLRPWLDDTEQLVAELPHDNTLHFLETEGDPDGIDLNRLLHSTESLRGHIREIIKMREKDKPAPRRGRGRGR